MCWAQLRVSHVGLFAIVALLCRVCVWGGFALRPLRPKLRLKHTLRDLVLDSCSMSTRLSQTPKRRRMTLLGSNVSGVPGGFRTLYNRSSLGTSVGCPALVFNKTRRACQLLYSEECLPAANGSDTSLCWTQSCNDPAGNGLSLIASGRNPCDWVNGPRSGQGSPGRPSCKRIFTCLQLKQCF